MQVFKGVKARGIAMGLATSFALTAPLHADVAQESAALGDYTVTLHLHPFLTDEDLTVLRFVSTSQDALALFLPSGFGSCCDCCVARRRVCQRRRTDAFGGCLGWIARCADRSH
ncbi:MAG: hypothetical protein U5N55_09190 [Cypionkella sp.]|nr:hypothetical protein [Cypionkella sp.]